MRHHLTRVATVVAAALMLVGLASAPALAAAGNHTVSYSRSWTEKSSPLGRCIVITASGTFTYTDSSTPSHTTLVYKWTNIKLNAPKIAASIQSLSGSTCSGTATLTKLTLQQSWAGYACSFNPTITIAVPFSVGISGWPSCGNRTQASYKTTYSTTSSTYTQNNSGSPVSFASTNLSGLPGSPPSGPCFGVFPSITAYVGSSSDSFGATNTTSGQVCLPW